MYINKLLCSFLSKFTRSCFSVARKYISLKSALETIFSDPNWTACSMKFSNYESALETILFPINSKLNCNSEFPRSENVLETNRFPRHPKQNCNSKLSWQGKSLETHKIHANGNLIVFAMGNRWEPCWKHMSLLHVGNYNRNAKFL